MNTIAQDAKILCEYRSTDVECLSYMQKQFESIFENAKESGVRIEINKVGERPCADIQRSKIEDLKNIIVPEIERVLGKKITFRSSSTDCNIPLSLGIPALCVGVNTHAGVHTREEWVDKDSVISGLKVAISIGLKLLNE